MRIFAVAAFVAWGMTVSADSVLETALRVPLERDVDVLVLGGGVEAVKAALAAKAEGARVFLAAPRPYLGDDRAGTLRLGPPDNFDGDFRFERDLWSSRDASFTYKTDAPTFMPHVDPGGKLADGRFGSAKDDTVEYHEAEVTVTADLGSSKPVTSVQTMTFRKGEECGVASVRVSASVDGARWSEPVAAKVERSVNAEGVGTETFVLPHLPQARYLKFTLVREPAATRMLVFGFSIRAGTEYRSVRPHELKSALDRALLSEGVDFMTGVMPTDALADADGRISGAILASRSGRGAVRAKAVVDASGTGLWPVLTGGGCPAKSGLTSFGRIVISRDRPSGKGIVVEPLAESYRSAVGVYGLRGGAFDASTWLCRLSLPVVPGDWSTFAEAEQKARDLTWTPGELDAADSLFRVDEPAFPGAAEGRRAATAAKARGPIGAVKVVRRADDGSPVCSGLGVREPLNGFRPFDRGLPRVELPAQKLPVLGRYDTVVVGGGTAGAPAAVAAARQGAKTLVVEYLYGLGGVSTLGQIGKYWYGNMRGFTAELEKGVQKVGAAMFIRGKEEWLRRECRRAGAEIWYGAAGCGVVTKGDKVTGVVVVTPCGRGVVLAKSVIDATGDAAVVAAAGGATEYLGDGELALQGTGLATRRLGRSFNNTDWGLANDGDATDVWLFGLRTRLGGPQNEVHDASTPWDFAQALGARERRRIRGVYTVTPADVVTERKFPDTVVLARSNFDSHGSTIDPLCFISERTDVDHRRAYRANVPYRAIVPEKLDGVLAIGLGMGAHRDALPIMRMQADLHNLGYAAGVAAAQVAKSGREFRDADVAAIQRELVKEDIIPAEVLKWTDSWPFTDARWREAVANCGDDYHDIAVVLSRPNEAVSALHRAYEAEKDARRRLVYASVLGILGSPVGAKTLVDWFEGRGPEFKIDFRPDQKHDARTKEPFGFGRRMSDRESLLVALGRTRDPAALPVLKRELGLLTAKSSPQSVRAASLAADAFARPELAKTVEDVLALPGMSGHSVKAVTDLPSGGGYGALPEVKNCQRELTLAHALLSCGDPHGKAYAIFRAYADDPRGVYALYAREVLRGDFQRTQGDLTRQEENK